MKDPNGSQEPSEGGLGKGGFTTPTNAKTFNIYIGIAVVIIVAMAIYFLTK